MSDETVASYVAAAIPVDSIENYVLQMTSSEYRPQVASALALAEVIRNIPSLSGEQAIQQLKLNWWLEEIELCEHAKTRHPLTKNLHGLVDHQEWLQPLRLLVSSSFEDIGRQPLSSLSDCLTFCHHRAEQQALTASVLPACNEQMLANARTAGVGISLSKLLAAAGSDKDSMLINGVDKTGELAPDNLATIALQHLAAVDPMSTETSANQLPVFLQARLHELQLLRLQKYGFNIQKARAGSFYLLWQAWREARKLIK